MELEAWPYTVSSVLIFNQNWWFNFDYSTADDLNDAIGPEHVGGGPGVLGTGYDSPLTDQVDL